jgi:hypothetical protein
MMTKRKIGCYWVIRFLSIRFANGFISLSPTFRLGGIPGDEPSSNEKYLHTCMYDKFYYFTNRNTNIAMYVLITTIPNTE